MAPTEKRCAKCKETKSPARFNFFARSRDGLQSYCKDCMRIAGRESRLRNPLPGRERARKWHAQNRARHAALIRARRARNPEKFRTAERARYHSNEKRRAQVKASSLKSGKKNAARHNFNVATRRATAISASPAWRNPFFIREAYDLARRRTIATGNRWHVDHIVPLRSKFVCGLHAFTNLQVIPQTVNARKHNCYWPEMP